MAWAVAAAILVLGALFLSGRRRVAYCLVAIIAALGAVLLLVNGPQNSQQADAVLAIARTDAASCPNPAAPIVVEVENKNERAVQRISFSLIGKLKGHSSVAYRSFLRDDKIIVTGQKTQTCYSLLPHAFAPPRPDAVVPANYEWSVDISLVDFSGR